MTIAEMFEHEKITLQHLWDIADESPYWFKASKFVVDNWELPADSLSDKQTKWLNAIYDDLVEMRIRRKGVFA